MVDVVLHLISLNRVLEGVHASFVESVPFKSILMFTLFQLVYLLVCFGVTWIPIAGILFPLLFFLLISIRQHILPKFFTSEHLRELDAAEYEEILGTPRRNLSLSFKVHPFWSFLTICCFRSSYTKLFGFSTCQTNLWEGFPLHN